MFWEILRFLADFGIGSAIARLVSLDWEIQLQIQMQMDMDMGYAMVPPFAAGNRLRHVNNNRKVI